MKKLIPLFFVFLIGCKTDPITLRTSVTAFRDHGLCVSWDHSGSNRIAYSIKEADGYYDVHLAMPDGSHDTCITCNHPALPNKHIANSYWHPSGKWLLAVVEKATHPGTSTDALPGFGAYCDIWLISDDGSKTYKLVDIPNDYDHGVIAPSFSPDGKHMVWADRKQQPNVLNPPQTMGFWTIKMCDFAFGTDSIPVVSNFRTFEPGGTAFYETYGFSPDGSKIIFCSPINQASVWNQLIYTIDTNGNNLTKLTDKDYNEHAVYTPDGTRIVWMTNTKSSYGGTDWWLMNADGTNKKQLTYFNEPNNPQSAGTAEWCGLVSFSPDGTKFIGGVQLSLTTQEGKIVMVELLP